MSISIIHTQSGQSCLGRKTLNKLQRVRPKVVMQRLVTQLSRRSGQRVAVVVTKPTLQKSYIALRLSSIRKQNAINQKGQN
ncbi:hypothetical protein FGO68_gene6682 [Halteria grandinella]|uniref:Uncharacterized protein n=1 Tax=Halteria grandinella TaxID=5974 RepID=A0A8J8NGA3_HALGN|nr:hypothetical protein FGO68_gene6682 [Halteria grandinella]